MRKDYLFLTEKPLPQSIEWYCVLKSHSPLNDVQEACAVLKKFEGYWIKADAIVCKLIEVKMPPGYTLVTWENNWHWCPLNICYSLFVPVGETHWPRPSF